MTWEIDVEDWAELANLGLGSKAFCKKARSAPPPQIRAWIAPPHETFGALALAGLVSGEADDATLVQRWRSALKVLGGLHTYSWRAMQRRIHVAAVATDPVSLAALQTAVANTAPVPFGALSVLAADGSPSSLDALVPHVERARADPSLLEQLASLRIYASTGSPVLELMARIDESLLEHQSLSPALSLARHLGLEVGEVFWFTIALRSIEPQPNGMPLVRAKVDIDSRRERALHISLTHATQGMYPVNFNTKKRDELRLGTFDLEDLPAWLRRSAAKLGIRWRPLEGLRTSVRGAKRRILMEWLATAHT